jgi:hypothetical protein
MNFFQVQPKNDFSVNEDVQRSFLNLYDEVHLLDLNYLNIHKHQ